MDIRIETAGSTLDRWLVRLWERYNGPISYDFYYRTNNYYRLLRYYESKLRQGVTPIELNALHYKHPERRSHPCP